VGDPAQNALTARIMELGWRPAGGDFELLPLVIETAAEGPCLFALPPDCRQEVRIGHGRHPWLEQLGLRWYAVPAVSDMALDLAGMLFRLAPFNGWYLDTEIAARNFSDTNRFNVLPRLAEGLGLDLRDERSLWRDRAQLVLAEAVLQSFDQAGVKIADHHTIGVQAPGQFDELACGDLALALGVGMPGEERWCIRVARVILESKLEEILLNGDDALARGHFSQEFGQQRRLAGTRRTRDEDGESASHQRAQSGDQRVGEQAEVGEPRQADLTQDESSDRQARMSRHAVFAVAAEHHHDASAVGRLQRQHWR